jgi:hypothetical protein
MLLEKLKVAAVKLLEASAESIEQALSQLLTSGSLLDLTLPSFPFNDIEGSE